MSQVRTQNEQAVIQLAFQAIADKKIALFKSLISGIDSDTMTDLAFSIIDKKAGLEYIEQLKKDALQMDKQKCFETLISFAAEKGEWDIVDWLLDNCVIKQKDKNTADQFKLGRVLLCATEAPLKPAVKMVKMFKKLFEYGAQNNMWRHDSSGDDCAIHYIAAQAAEFKPVLILLVLNDDFDHINTRNKKSKLPIEIAVENKNYEFVEILSNASDLKNGKEQIKEALINFYRANLFHPLFRETVPSDIFNKIFSLNNFAKHYYEDDQLNKNVDEHHIIFFKSDHCRTLLRARCALEKYEAKHPQIPLENHPLLQWPNRSEASILFFRAVKNEVAGLKIKDTADSNKKEEMQLKVQNMKKAAMAFLGSSENEKANAFQIGKYFSLFIEKSSKATSSVANPAPTPNSTTGTFTASSGSLTSTSSSSTTNLNKNETANSSQTIENDFALIDNQNKLSYRYTTNF